MSREEGKQRRSVTAAGTCGTGQRLIWIRDGRPGFSIFSHGTVTLDPVVADVCTLSVSLPTPTAIMLFGHMESGFIPRFESFRIVGLVLS